MVKIDMEELAKGIIDNYGLIILEDKVNFTRFEEDDVLDVIDNYIYKNLGETEQFSDMDYQEIMNDLTPFLILESYKRLKEQLNKFDEDDRKIVSENMREYKTYEEAQ